MAVLDATLQCCANVHARTMRGAHTAGVLTISGRRMTQYSETVQAVVRCRLYQTFLLLFEWSLLALASSFAVVMSTTS